MPEVFLALGANLGDRRQNLRAAARALAEFVGEIRASSLYESVPVGVTDQPLFLNAVLVGRTELAAEALLDRTQEIEIALGRRPGPRWGPRPIDIDLLLYGDAAIETPRLTVPHPRMHERGFVLRPLADLAPGKRIGVIGSAGELLDVVGAHDLEEVEGPGWIDEEHDASRSATERPG